MLRRCDYQVVPFGLVSVGKSTKARLQSTAWSGSTARVAAPVTVTRASADGRMGRLVALTVRLASDEIRAILVGSSATT